MDSCHTTLPADWIITDEFSVGDIVRPNDRCAEAGFNYFYGGEYELPIVKIDCEFGYTRLWLSNGMFAFPKNVTKVLKGS